MQAGRIALPRVEGLDDVELELFTLAVQGEACDFRPEVLAWARSAPAEDVAAAIAVSRAARELVTLRRGFGAVWEERRVAAANAAGVGTGGGGGVLRGG